MMARDWRRLALTVGAAAAVGSICAFGADAQNTAKKPAKKPAAAQSQNADGEKAAPKKKKQDPAEAQRTIEAAQKLLETGKADQAVLALTTTLAGGSLPPAIMAKALLYRGIGYRQQKMPAQAIADLTSALWLKGGLAESDRADALKQRSAAYQEAGLSESGEAVAAAVPAARKERPAERTAERAADPSEPAAAPAPKSRPDPSGPGWRAATSTSAPAPAAPAPAASSSQGSGWGFLGDLFSGGNASSQQAATPAPTTASIQEPAPRAPASSGWARNTEVHGSSAGSQVVTSAIPSKPEGRFRVQVGIVRTQAEAVALAQKVKRDHGNALAAREPEIDQAVVGNMGSFYRVRVGPFATQQETQALCAKLKGTGLDCLAVAQ